MAYSAFDPSKPNGATGNGTSYSQSIRDNFKALRDYLVLGAAKGWDYSQCAASFAGSISGTTLTVSSVSSGHIVEGMTIAGAGVTAGTRISAQLSGTQFGAGTYSLTVSQTVSSVAMTAACGDPAFPDAWKYSSGSERLLANPVWNANGDPASIQYWYYNGTAWDLIGTETYTYDVNQNVTASTWS